MPRTVCSRATPKPLLPVAVAEFLATVLPDASPQQRQDVFDDTVNTEGGLEAAVAFFKRFHDVVASGVMMGAPSPPVNAEIKSTDVGPFTIFYHPTFPRHLQENNLFMWNFYIGRRGQGVCLIMPDLAQQGIVVKIPGLTGEWGECQALTILPSTRVRLTYYDTPAKQSQIRGGASNRVQVTHELVFSTRPAGILLHPSRANLFNSSVCCASTTAGRSEFGRHEIATDVAIPLHGILLRRHAK
ncbi:hypothetical protein B0H14DRAFT_2752636 [Mycena olivaceomarginata]|nr:hypothetical protein B0H14DRAFT_2752636 [Mycena olivaceomarginata]